MTRLKHNPGSGPWYLRLRECEIEETGSLTVRVLGVKPEPLPQCTAQARKGRGR